MNTMSRIFDDEESHFTRLLPAPRLVGAIAGAMVALTVFWLWVTVDDRNARVILTGSVLLASASAFLAGNTYRLKDYRRRMLVMIRFNPRDRHRLLAVLPPKQTIRARMVIAGIGFVLGIVAVLGATAVNASDQYAEVVVVAVLILVSCVTCVAAGTYTRPLD